MKSGVGFDVSAWMRAGMMASLLNQINIQATGVHIINKTSYLALYSA